MPELQPQQLLSDGIEPGRLSGVHQFQPFDLGGDALLLLAVVPSQHKVARVAGLFAIILFVTLTPGLHVSVTGDRQATVLLELLNGLAARIVEPLQKFCFEPRQQRVPFAKAQLGNQGMGTWRCRSAHRDLRCHAKIDQPLPSPLGGESRAINVCRNQLVVLVRDEKTQRKAPEHLLYRRLPFPGSGQNLHQFRAERKLPHRETQLMTHRLAKLSRPFGNVFLTTVQPLQLLTKRRQLSSLVTTREQTLVTFLAQLRRFRIEFRLNSRHPQLDSRECRFVVNQVRKFQPVERFTEPSMRLAFSLHMGTFDGDQTGDLLQSITTNAFNLIVQDSRAILHRSNLGGQRFFSGGDLLKFTLLPLDGWSKQVDSAL